MNHPIKISMLHGDFRHNDVAKNIEKIETLFLAALEHKPDLIITSELAVSGYEFLSEIGSDWIKSLVPEIIEKFKTLAKTDQVSLILGCPKYNPEKQKFFNSAIFINQFGEIEGEHDKLSVLPGSEGWSSSGEKIEPISWNDQKIGILICADAYHQKIAQELAHKGAKVLLSPAAWAPGLHGPNGEWEARSQETSLPIYVCNRTGAEQQMVFSGGASIVAVNGVRVVNYSEAREAILSIDVHPETWLPLKNSFAIKYMSA